MTAEIARIRRAEIDDLTIVQAIGRDTYLEHFAHYWSDAGLQTFLQRDFSDEPFRSDLDEEIGMWVMSRRLD